MQNRLIFPKEYFVFGNNRLFISLFLLALSFSCYAQGNVPAQYQAIYNTVNTDISNFSATINANWDGTPSPVINSAQLQTALSDLTTNLLQPNYYQYVVLPELNVLQALGVTAVTFHINFPALLPSYYGDPADYQAYLNFYTQLMIDIRSRGLTVIIENTIANPFPGTNGYTYTSYYQSLDWNTYVAQRSQLAANIAQLLKPDYLVLQTEPDSESNATGQTNAGTVSGSAQMVQSMTTAVRNVEPSSVVKIGAGCGTWDPSFLQFEQSFASMPLDFVDMHIYPVNQSFLPNALAGAQLINAAGKSATMSEMWPYKVADSELGVLDYTTIYSRDPFSFWEPLDQYFLQVISQFANYQNFAFISPYWSHYFSAYLDYGVYGTQSPTNIINAENTASVAALGLGEFTPTGAVFESLNIPGPDTTPPVVAAPPALTGLSQSVVGLTWSATTDDVGVAGYNLYRNGALLFTINGPLAYSDHSVMPNTMYQYSVAAFDASGNVATPSAPLVVTTLLTPDKTPPSVPTGLTATPFSDTQISLTWNPSTDNVGVTGYEIYRGTSPTVLAPWATSPSNSYLDTKEAPSSKYYFAVDAYDAVNNHSGKSAVVAITTLPDTTPPTTPTNVSAVAVSGPAVVVAWAASTDDYAVASYRISRGTSPTSMVLLAGTPAATLKYTDSKALSGKTYYYSVTAYDVAGNPSVASSPVVVTVH